MMNFPGEGSPEPGIRDVYYECPIGATGALGTAVRNRSITSVSRSGAGVYVFTVDPDFAGAATLVDYSAQVVDSAPAAGNGLWGVVTAKSANVYTVTFVNGSTVAADVRNGASIVIHFAIKASTV